MARLISRTGGLTNEQIATVYALAKKFKVGISLYQNTPTPTRDSFTWLVKGNVFRIVRFMRHLRSMR